jgi:hypothetical protein
MTSNLLINEPPRLVLPTAACLLGLPGALMMQQLHFLLGISQNVRDGRTWVYKTLEEWQEQFPWWSTKTIQRTLRSLRDRELIIATDEYNQSSADRTLWYTINYEALKELWDGHVVHPNGQVVHVIEEDKVSTSYQIEDIDTESLPPSRLQTDPLLGELVAFLGGANSFLGDQLSDLQGEIGDDALISEAIAIARDRGKRSFAYMAGVARGMKADREAVKQNSEAARALLSPRKAS